MAEENLTILITGHCGYIGDALVQMINRKRPFWHVVGYDLYEGQDITNSQNLRIVMTTCRPKIVINLAALSTVPSCSDNPTLAFKTNALAVRDLLKLMKEVGCLHLIHASTCAVYGSSTEALAEYYNKSPISIYGLTKLLAENIIYQHYQNNKGNYIVFRMFNVIGYNSPIQKHEIHENSDRLMQALQNGYVTIYGRNYPTNDGTAERDYISLKDVCRAYIKGVEKIIKTSNEMPSIRLELNLCSGIPISVYQMIKEWRSIVEPVTFRFGKRRKEDPAKVYGDPTNVQTLINFTIRDNLKAILTSYKKV